MRVRLAALLGLASALGERGRRLAQTSGAQAILDPGLGHRQPVGLGGAPAIGGEPAFERGAAAGTGNAGGGRGSGVMRASLRAVESKGKIVI